MRLNTTLCALLVAASAARSARAQRARLIGSPDEDRARVSSLLRPDSSDWTIRSPSARDTSSGRWTFALTRPVVDGFNNTQIPFGLNTGTLWAGRGTSERLTWGVLASVGRFHLSLVPEIAHTANLGFALLPDTFPGRSDYGSPFYSGLRSIDLPVRLGARPTTRVAPGQSAAWVNAGVLDVGVSTENQWWGPAVQNALIMSNNAEGIPSAFVRTRAPIQTPIGTFNAKAIVGELTESLYFDDNASNDHRSISGIVASYSPTVEPNVTLGLARVVYANLPSGARLVGHAVDALTQWSTVRGDSSAHGVDQLYSLFGRWVFPSSGLEIYGEWARMLPPVSVRDWLVAPQYSLGYTIGMQAAHPLSNGAVLRFQTEFTNLEQTAATVGADTLTFYTSRAVPQGYTQRGKSIGAAIGPGGSSQMLGLDYMPSRWAIGAFAERIRWNEDVYYSQPTGVAFFAHDVAVLAGLRGSYRRGRSEVHLEYSTSQRLDFEFQNVRGGFGEQRANDFHNRALRFWIAP